MQEERDYNVYFFLIALNMLIILNEDNFVIFKSSFQGRGTTIREKL